MALFLYGTLRDDVLRERVFGRPVAARPALFCRSFSELDRRCGRPGRPPGTDRGRVAWRDFAHHLAFHTPRLTTANRRQEWDALPRNGDERLQEVRA